MLFAFAGSAFGQLTWENPEQTFNAKPDEQSIVAKYRFTNNGKGPVRIEEVKTSCDCTMAVLTKTEYAPGESDVQTGKEIRRFEGHRKAFAMGVLSLAYSPDGRSIASGDHDGTVQLWDVQTGKEIRQLEGHTNSVMSVTFSPDGRWIASGGWDETVRLWDIETGKEIRRLERDIDIHRKARPPDSAYNDVANSVAFSPDSRLIVSNGIPGIVLLWDAQTGKEIRRFKGHTDIVRSVAFSPDRSPDRLWGC